MIPIHFGRRDRLLFGLYTPARGRRRQRGVVVCNPFGDEMLRAHRSLRLLTELLAESGLDVFRFDYYGTGDSMGDDLDVTLGGWIQDAELAVDELKGLATIRQTSIVGLRLGALVAAEVARRRPRDVDRLVLWEPVLDGARYVAELQAEARTPCPLEVRGFRVSQQMTHELGSVQPKIETGPRCRLLVAVGSKGDRSYLDSLGDRAMELMEVQSPRCWVEDRDFGAGAVPREMLTRIAAWLN